jgi:hypothetical protein
VALPAGAAERLRHRGAAVGAELFLQRRASHRDTEVRERQHKVFLCVLQFPRAVLCVTSIGREACGNSPSRLARCHSISSSSRLDQDVRREPGGERKR